MQQENDIRKMTILMLTQFLFKLLTYRPVIIFKLSGV